MGCTWITKCTRSAVHLFVILGLLGANAQGADGAEPQPPDVFVQVVLFQNRLESIRGELDKPKESRSEILVHNAVPREVYFQAQTLFKKTARLGFELTRKQFSPPPSPTGDIRPVYVHSLVLSARGILLQVQDELDIPRDTLRASRDGSKTSNDVFRAIVQSNRQLNLLLDLQYSPSDVFQKVTQAIYYSASLLRHFPSVQIRIPDPPAFVDGKVPSQVYQELFECFTILQDIAGLSGVQILNLLPQDDFSEVVPSDVYDLASLLVSELDFIYQKTGATVPLDSYYPGSKTPSHVYQRVGILKQQLREILEHVQSTPEWLPRSTKKG